MSMNLNLAMRYNTLGVRDRATALQVKTAAFVKVAEEEQLDLANLSEEELVELAQQWADQNNITDEAALQAALEEGGEGGDGGEASYEPEGEDESTPEEKQASAQADEFFQLCELGGKVMAHSMHREQNEIAKVAQAQEEAAYYELTKIAEHYGCSVEQLLSAIAHAEQEGGEKQASAQQQHTLDPATEAARQHPASVTSFLQKLASPQAAAQPPDPLANVDFMKLSSANFTDLNDDQIRYVFERIYDRHGTEGVTKVAKNLGLHAALGAAAGGTAGALGSEDSGKGAILGALLGGAGGAGASKLKGVLSPEAAAAASPAAGGKKGVGTVRKILGALGLAGTGSVLGQHGLSKVLPESSVGPSWLNKLTGKIQGKVDAYQQKGFDAAAKAKASDTEMNSVLHALKKAKDPTYVGKDPFVQGRPTPIGEMPTDY